MEISLKNGVYCLVGRIDEFADLDHLNRAAAPLKLNLGKVTAVNSIGVRKFLAFALSWAPRKMEFYECTPEFIGNVNVIPQLVGTIQNDAPIKSFYVPFQCPACKHVDNTLSEVSKMDFDSDGQVVVPTKTCTKCGDAMELDAEPSEYFIFLERQRIAT